MKRIAILIAFFTLALSINAQNTPPVIQANSTSAAYGEQACIDIETSDADGDSVFIGFVTQIPKSVSTTTSLTKVMASGQICVTPERGVHSDKIPNTSIIFATDKKDTVYKTVAVTIPRYPYDVRPTIEKLNNSTFRIDVKGDKNEPWDDYPGLKFECKIYDPNQKLIATYTNQQVFTFQAPLYQKYILYTSYVTSTPMAYGTRDTLIPDMNVNTFLPSKNAFSIYPNPAREEIFIKNLPANSETIKVYDVVGKQIQELPATVNAIHINKLPEGVYWLEVQSKDAAVARQKFIKKY